MYTPALENGYTPDSLVDDIYFDGGPKNSDGQYDGAVTLRYAVEKSKNVVAWKLFSERGPQDGVSYIQKMNFKKITPNDYYAPAALGGLYYGVTAEEMASGYATIAYDGVFRQPSCIVSFKDRNGAELYQESGKVRVYEKNAARMMTDILCGVVSAGTAKGLVIESNPDMPAACKTGTTNGQTCGWFCGYTPYYTCAVYVGADSAEAVDSLSGASYPKDIWSRTQSYLCRNKKVKKFKEYHKEPDDGQTAGKQVTDGFLQDAPEPLAPAAGPEETAVQAGPEESAVQAGLEESAAQAGPEQADDLSQESDMLESVLSDAEPEESESAEPEPEDPEESESAEPEPEDPEESEPEPAEMEPGLLEDADT